MSDPSPAAADMNIDTWDEVSRLPADADPTDVLYAASRDFAGVARRLDAAESERALVFTVGDFDFVGSPMLEVGVSVPAAGGPTADGRAGDGRRVRLGHRVIIACRDKGVGPLGLLAYALLAPEPLGSTWRPRRIGEALPPSAEQLAEQREVFRYTPAYDAVENALSKGHDVLLQGDHGSGRSALAANVAEQRGNAGRGVVWLNLTDPADGPESVMWTLLQIEHAEDYLLIIDGLHANLPVVTAVFGCVKRLRHDFRLPIRVLAIGLNTVAELLRQGERILDLQDVPIDGRETIRQMLDDDTSHDPAARARIEELVDSDVHMAATAVQLYRRTGQVPTRLDLQRVYTGDTRDPREQRALYHLACLGSLGLVIARREAESLFGDCVNRLHERNLVHRTDDAYTIGPRRRAELVMQYAREAWPERCEAMPEDIAWRHLQKSGARAIRAMLSQLDRFVSYNQLRSQNLMLLSTWDTLERLAAALEQKVDDDPTWDDNLGAAVFAAMALTRLRPDDHERWARIATPIRDRWRYLDPGLPLPEPVGPVTADSADFVEIVKRMRVEDSMFAPKPHPSGLQADDVDQDRAYRNWVLGLLLGLEGTAPPGLREQRRIDALVAMARRAQHPDGSFYPERVPWVTARVLIGLCQAGQRDTNSVVWDACRWLLRQLGDGLGSSRWRSGTGDWNSDEATTAMCLTGLYLANVKRRPAMEAATAWLESREDAWTRKDQEIDLANALETLALYSRSSIQEHLMTLLNRVQSELRAPKPVTNPLPEERLRVPFITSQLANMVWQTVRAECRALLRDVMRGHAEEGSTAPGTDVARPQPATAEGGERATGLTPEQLRRWTAAAEQFQHTLIAEMNKRRGAVSNVPSVQQALGLLHDQRDRYQALVEQLGPDVAPDVLWELDELGRAVCGMAWPNNLPFPTDKATG